MQPTNQMFDDSPALDGPDYVALVIEWDEPAGSPEEVPSEKTLVIPRLRPLRALGAMVGAIGLMALAVWGVNRWRAA